jgi:hypothetical protein
VFAARIRFDSKCNWRLRPPTLLSGIFVGRVLDCS